MSGPNSHNRGLLESKGDGGQALTEAHVQTSLFEYQFIILYPPFGKVIGGCYLSG